MSRNCCLPWLLAAVIATLAPSIAFPQNDGDHDEAAKLDEDLAFQGEYSGSLASDSGSDIKIGVQVIALGNGRFQAVGHHGGLPGDGWDGEEVVRVEGSRSGDKVIFTHDGTRAEILGGKSIEISVDDGVIGKLKKVERESPTLGREAPAGAIVLFDGKSADHFPGARLTDDGLLEQGATSRHKFQDCELHVEFQLPFMPEARDQGRGNSGVYLQGRYEVQVLDSFGLDGRDNECGGIYSIKAPALNMCYPPSSWQTYDIVFRAARFDANKRKTADARLTVRHNGVLIHDSVAVPHVTTAAPFAEGPEPGPLYLQDHGNPVRFRNIWIVEM